MIIKSIKARQISDSRGKPTIECDIKTNDGNSIASIPCGASRGDYEAAFIDNDRALKNINDKISKKIIGMDIQTQEDIDNLLIEMDGTSNKRSLGANTILAVSIAAFKAGALSSGMPLYKYTGNLIGNKRFFLPMPVMVFIEGGKHSKPEFSSTDLQEFMIVPSGAKTFSEAMKFGKEVYDNLRKYLESKGLDTKIGDEGAFTPKLGSNEKAIEILSHVIEESGYAKKISIAIDAAASELFRNGRYALKKEGSTVDSSELVDIYREWAEKYPITYLEDGLSQDDWKGWSELNSALGKKINIVGDDLTVTNIKRLETAIRKKAINAVIIKPTQIGTISETLEFTKMAKKNKMATVVSQRGGETMDTFKSDLCVGINGEFAKFGAPSRPERIVKYNRLLEIEESGGLGYANLHI